MKKSAKNHRKKAEIWRKKHQKWGKSLKIKTNISREEKIEKKNGKNEQ